MPELNGLKLPKYLLDTINEAANYFGDTLEDSIYNSINRQVQNKDPEIIKALNESFNKQAILKNAFTNPLINLEESDKGYLDLSQTFWGKVENAINQDLKIIIERENIEGDGQDPNDEDQASEDGRVDSSEEEQNQEQPSPEQILQMELIHTDNKYATLITYDKINETLKSVSAIKQNIYSSDTEDQFDLYTQLENYETYLKLLGELIFVMDINTVYYNLTNIIVELNALYDKYLIATKIKTLNSGDSNSNTKAEAIKALVNNKESNTEMNQELYEG